MAVHAQHPSNVLFLSRNGQEGHVFSLQPQQGDFLDQPHMLFNNGDSNPRKRGRESTASQINSHQFSLQSQSPQVIDLSLLNNQHYHRSTAPETAPNIVSTGLRLSSGEEQPQSLNGRLYPQYRNENRNLVSSPSSGLLSVLSNDFTAQINQQRDELDKFLLGQAEELRRTLVEKTRRYYSALIRAVEEPLTRMLREKDAEVERATHRREELEARAAQLTAEAQAWQARALAHEATAGSLQAQLQQAIGVKTTTEGLMCSARGSGLELGTEDAESAYMDPDRLTDVMTSFPSCKACQIKVATVVVLPCRHLSLCPECDGSASACPVCLTLRNSSVEAFLR